MRTVRGRVIGSVLGHEKNVVHSLQQHLQPRHVALKLQDNEAVEPASITLLFHRKKARLPQDEIEALLDKALSQGTTVCLCLLILVDVVLTGRSIVKVYT